MVLPEIALGVVFIIEAVLLGDLIAGLEITNWLIWIVLHIVCSCLTVFFFDRLVSGMSKDSLLKTTARTQSGSSVSGQSQSGSFQSGFSQATLSQAGQAKIGLLNSGFSGLVLFSALLIPGVGGLGIVLALVIGMHQAARREYGQNFWQITEVAELPFISPAGRMPTQPDSRGVTEHLIYSSDDDDIYRKVLATANIKASLAIDALRQAMRHHDERIRLTAYKALDGKVEALNQKIRDLELKMDEVEENQRSDTWLQIASNYWELLTLGGGEPVARAQLLEKAKESALKAVVCLPSNRNAHYLLGRISLVGGDTAQARFALQQSQILGMPAEKIIPYLAECAYVERDFTSVRKLLSRLDPAVIQYPPLSHVAEYWT